MTNDMIGAPSFVESYYLKPSQSQIYTQTDILLYYLFFLNL